MAKAFDPRNQRQYELNQRQYEFNKQNQKGNYYHGAHEMWVAGTTYKSALEANWAIYLLHNDIEFEYEPSTITLKDNEPYTPDFYLPEYDYYVECKSQGAWDNDRETVLRKLKELVEVTGKYAYLVTAPPIFLRDGEIWKIDIDKEKELYHIPASLGGTVQKSGEIKWSFIFAKEQIELKAKYEAEQQELRNNFCDERNQCVKEMLKDYNIPYEAFAKDNKIEKVKHSMVINSPGSYMRDKTPPAWKNKDTYGKLTWDDDQYAYDLETCIKLGIHFFDDPDVPYADKWGKTIREYSELVTKFCKASYIVLDDYSIPALEHFTEAMKNRDLIPGKVQINTRGQY